MSANEEEQEQRAGQEEAEADMEQEAGEEVVSRQGKEEVGRGRLGASSSTRAREQPPAPSWPTCVSWLRRGTRLPSR